ncbi:hypothetical protein ACGE32_29935, partial [Klebsiella pneumoniae]
LVANPSFANAQLDTGLIEREQALLFPPGDHVPDDVWLIAALAELLRERRVAAAQSSAAADPQSPWRRLDGWRLNGVAERRLSLRVRDTLQEVGVSVAAGSYRLTVGGRSVLANGTASEGSKLHAQFGDRRLHAVVVIAGERRQVFFEGHS